MHDERTVSGLLRQRAATAPDRAYLKVDDGDWITLGEMDERSDRVAAGLTELGLHKGDTLAVLLPSCEETLEISFACAKLGVIQVPMNFFLKGEFLRYQIAHSGARVLITDHEGRAAAQPIIGETSIDRVVLVGESPDRMNDQVDYDDVRTSSAQVPSVAVDRADLMAIIYTSGTTGLPKGCMLSHGYYTSIPQTYLRAGWLAEGDRVYTALQLYHMGGVQNYMGALVANGSAAFTSTFSASEFIPRAAAAECTTLFGVGPTGMAILASPPRPSDGDHPFRLAMFVPMPPDRQAEFEARFNTPVVSEILGQTECSPVTISSTTGKRNRASCGLPAPHVDAMLVDDLDQEVGPGEVGELVFRPREPFACFSGYWRDGEATGDAWRNLWHHTGDHARRDEDGYVYFVDRKKDSMRRRGENVSSFELEVAIMKHPAVLQVAVCGVPSPLGEDDIKAFIVPAPGATPAADDLFEFFRVNVPYFAIPRYVDIRESLPTNAAGRVMKHILRAEEPGADVWDLEALGFRVEKSERR